MTIFEPAFRPSDSAEPVRLHDDVGGDAEAAREIVDGLAFLDGDAGAAGARPALDVALFGKRRLGLDRAGRGGVELLGRLDGSGLDRLCGGSARRRCRRHRRQRAAGDRACVGAVGLGGGDRLRVAGIGLGARGVAARADDLALVGGRRGHEVVHAAESGDLGTASGGHSRQEKDRCPLRELQSATLQNTDLHGNDPRIPWTQLAGLKRVNVTGRLSLSHLKQI